MLLGCGRRAGDRWGRLVTGSSTSLELALNLTGLGAARWPCAERKLGFNCFLLVFLSKGCMCKLKGGEESALPQAWVGVGLEGVWGLDGIALPMNYS